MALPLPLLVANMGAFRSLGPAGRIGIASKNPKTLSLKK